MVCAAAVPARDQHVTVAEQRRRVAVAVVAHRAGGRPGVGRRVVGEPGVLHAGAVLAAGDEDEAAREQRPGGLVPAGGRVVHRRARGPGVGGDGVDLAVVEAHGARAQAAGDEHRGRRRRTRRDERGDVRVARGLHGRDAAPDGIDEDLLAAGIGPELDASVPCQEAYRHRAAARRERRGSGHPQRVPVRRRHLDRVAVGRRRGTVEIPRRHDLAARSRATAQVEPLLGAARPRGPERRPPRPVVGDRAPDDDARPRGADFADAHGDARRQLEANRRGAVPRQRDPEGPVVHRRGEALRGGRERSARLEHGAGVLGEGAPEGRRVRPDLRRKQLGVAAPCGGQREKRCERERAGTSDAHDGLQGAIGATSSPG